MTSKVKRILTGLAGLPVHKEPHRELTKWYNRILTSLEELPKDSGYRVQTEKVVKERKNIVASTPDPEELERKIGGGLCEELIVQARHEHELIQTMKEAKPWEPMVEKPNPDQWKWPVT